MLVQPCGARVPRTCSLLLDVCRLRVPAELARLASSSGRAGSAASNSGSAAARASGAGGRPPRHTGQSRPSGAGDDELDVGAIVAGSRPALFDAIDPSSHGAGTGELSGSSGRSGRVSDGKHNLRASSQGSASIGENPRSNLPSQADSLLSADIDELRRESEALLASERSTDHQASASGSGSGSMDAMGRTSADSSRAGKAPMVAI